MIGFTLVGCGARATGTPIPLATPTPRATLLPPVPTLAPFGTTDKPYEIVILPPADSDTSTKGLTDFLAAHTTLAFKINLVTTEAELLDKICSPDPTFVWADGWVLMAAQAQGCGNITLKIKQGSATSVQSDLIISAAAAIDTLAQLRLRAKSRDFCRMGSQDMVSWILPVAMLRAPGFDPLTGFKSAKDYGDINQLVQDVSDNKCLSAIPSGTLNTFRATNVVDITKTVKVLATSPELPIGGLMVSLTVPRKDADTVTTVFADNVDQLSGLVNADSLLTVSNADFADTLKAFQTAGLNFAALGH